MASQSTSVRRLLSSVSASSPLPYYGTARNVRILSSRLSTRKLCSTPARQTDGVFRGLTDNRPRLPWIEAFKQQQEGKAIALGHLKPEERDMSPKKMSDSYHRIVLPLGRDPSLSDTYINSSGHIRYNERPSYATSRYLED